MIRKKSRIVRKTDQFGDRMMQSPYVQKQIAKARQEGLIDEFLESYAQEIAGAASDEYIEILQNNILKVVQTRFPQLSDLAQQKVRKITERNVLQDLFYHLLVATDQGAAWQILEL